MKPGDENRNLGDLRALAAEEELRKIKERSPKLRRAARKAQKPQRPKFSAADLSETDEAPAGWEEGPSRESRRPRATGAPRTAASATGERLSTALAPADVTVGAGNCTVLERSHTRHGHKLLAGQLAHAGKLFVE